MMQHLTSILNQFGLADKESALYLASLTLGESGMSELAQKAKLKRTSAYVVFKALEQKGLMGSFKMRSGTKFVATPPEVVIRKTEQQLMQLQAVLPEFQAIQDKANGPKITYFEGEEGYRVAAEDSLKFAGETIRHIGSLEEIHKVISRDYDINYYIPKRIHNRIRLKALYFKSDFNETNFMRDDGAELRQIRFLPESFKYPTSLLIYGNKVAFFSTAKELITVIIESADLVESERKKFDLMWELLDNKETGV
ncbi:MAG TPA: helix-turn-helix domain-containing protein [Patescibacteria group bacterium]